MRKIQSVFLICQKLLVNLTALQDSIIHLAGTIFYHFLHRTVSSFLFFLFLPTLDKHFKISTLEQSVGNPVIESSQRISASCIGRRDDTHLELSLKYSEGPKEIISLLISQPEILPLLTIW
jgi:hypothetical protein